MADTLSPDDAQALAALVKQQAKATELAGAAVQSFGAYLCEKYKIAPPDQLLADGSIVRAAKDAGTPDA